MNLRTAYKLAVVLTKSQLRGYQRNRLLARIFGDPRVIAVGDAAIIGGLGLLSYLMLRVLPHDLQSVIQQTETQGLAGIPTAMIFVIILFGILSEISQPVQSMSTDLVNWLPITPAEYVAGSTISISYTYSFMLSLFLGVALGPAIAYGLVHVWIVATIFSVLSLLVGACVVEMLRSLTNRISSSFYKKSGRSGIFVRLTLTIIVLVFFQLLFSGQIIVYLLQSIIQTVQAGWFVPIVWPSLVVVSASQGGTIMALLFGVLSLAFLFAVFGLAVNFRVRFWVPIPVSIKLSTSSYRPAARKLLLPGFDLAESAILRKDLRSLTRRREMARFLAIPFVLAVSMAVSLFPLGGRPIAEGPGFFATIPLYLIPIAISCNIISMTSIGQEGYAVWNLYTAPLEPRQLLKPKLLMAVLFGLIFTVIMIAVLGLFLKPVFNHFIVFLISGIAVSLEQSAFGLYFGVKYPDFRETVRSRFVSVWGSLVGTMLGLVIAMLTAAPILASIFFGQLAMEAGAIATVAIGLIVFFASWRLAKREARFLLQNIKI